jgi:predicted HTH transcriptional regulator
MYGDPMTNTLDDEGLKATELAVLEFLKVNESITNRKLRQITNVNYDQAIFFFNRMIEKGVLNRIGVASGTHYTLATSKS